MPVSEFNDSCNYQFNRKMLPILGVSIRSFETEAEALAFMDWAEKETESDMHPCTSYWFGFDGEFHNVKIKNW